MASSIMGDMSLVGFGGGAAAEDEGMTTTLDDEDGGCCGFRRDNGAALTGTTVAAHATSGANRCHQIAGRA
ncbi:hypothetical protein AMAG_20554 [Allomyces macrogynus ATCC 38327]|uniref:Uncharacterized protein n=1 Tax=Allomyces macrogynus (strain ATCC 38327) TaxID=578462 RepID=A0A0L0TBP7_ALLM3|nr:hypothetical protein AMAG_20554 [Allomyces macrogynus ATCC 38327]|eukprot:KNE72187.1 hypothetical protein AMAG_20554 [Allomyces macrogynus ATCC 38327]